MLRWAEDFATRCPYSSKGSIIELVNGQVFWLPDRLPPKPSHDSHSSRGGVNGFYPRVQRRDRDGFSPSSLFTKLATNQFGTRTLGK